MTIKIKELNIKKDVILKGKNTNEWGISTNTKLYGEMKLGFSKGIAKGTGEIEVTDISEKLQNKLYDVLGEIENELNGVSVNTDAYSWESAISMGAVGKLLNKEWEAAKVELGDGSIKVPSKVGGGFTATTHNGETVLTSDGTGNIHLKGNVEFSDAKLKQPEESKSHDTDKDENKQIDQVLDEVGKIFNIVFNINQESDNKQIAKKIAERIKDNKGKF